MILAEKVASLRKRNGWSQEELADKLGISRQSVSKWESGASIPDIDKIIMMSKLFGVSTDYLLKDEIQEIAYSETDDAEGSGVRSVSLEDANTFMNLVRSLACPMGLATALCVLSPVPLILLAGLSESGRMGISENMAGGIGTSILMVLVAVGVATLIMLGMRLAKYDFLEKEEITLQYGVQGIAEKRKEEFAGKFRACIIVGVVLCILGVVPLFMAAAFSTEDFAMICCVAVLLVMVAVAVYLFVWAGSIEGSFNKLLQVEDFSLEQKAVQKKTSFFPGAYWCLVTAVFLGAGFFYGEWKDVAMIWPVAALLFVVIRIVMNAVIRSRMEK